jgi:DNA polymerase-3 subunit delta'
MSFADVVGHTSAIRLLKGYLCRGGEMPPILLIGPDGIGKQTLGLAFAKAWLCLSSVGGEACGQCISCQRVAEGNHPDLAWVKPDRNGQLGEVAEGEGDGTQVGIEKIRALHARLYLTPFGGARKAALLFDAERLTEEAMNACLKILEDPPTQTLFVLTTHAPHGLLPTVVSRCVKIRCFPQGVEVVCRHLVERCGRDPKEAKTVAMASSGRLGLALRWAEGDGLAKKNAMLDELLLARRARRLEIPLGKADRQKVLEALEWYAAWLRDRIVLQLAGPTQWIIHQDRLADLQKGEGSTSHDIFALVRSIRRIYQVHEAIENHAGTRVALGALLSDV